MNATRAIQLLFVSTISTMVLELVMVTW